MAIVTFCFKKVVKNSYIFFNYFENVFFWYDYEVRETLNRLVGKLLSLVPTTKFPINAKQFPLVFS